MESDIILKMIEKYPTMEERKAFAEGMKVGISEAQKIYRDIHITSDLDIALDNGIAEPSIAN